MQLEFELEKQQNDKFKEYHEKYPSVYKSFKKLAIKTIRMGHKKFSARGVFQVMRWKRGGDIKDDGFKFNNNHTPYYVRLFEKDCPEHKGFFETRKSKYDMA